MTIILDVEINNPYPFEINLNGVRLGFYNANKQIMLSKIDEKISLKTSRATIQKVELKLLFDDIYKIVKNYKSSPTFPIRVDSQILVSSPIKGFDMSLTKNIEIEGENIVLKDSATIEIPSIAPTLSISKVELSMPTSREIQNALISSSINKSSKDVEGMLKNLIGKTSGNQSVQNQSNIMEDLKGLDLPIGVNFELLLKNSGGAEMVLNKLKYTLKVDNENVASGVSPTPKKSGDGYKIPISSIISTKNITTNLLKSLQNGAGKYTFDAGSNLTLPNTNIKKPIDINIKKEGNLTFK